MSVKRFQINYDAINEKSTFSSGDFICGRVMLEVSKQVKVSSLSVKCKGEADVYWTEKNGDNDDSYSAHERYFKLKQFIIPEKNPKEECETLLTQGVETYSNVIVPGVHVYPFSFQIPQGNLPSSFKGAHGKILYSLEATLRRSMRIPSTAKAEFTFLSNPDGDINHLMEPLSGTTQKKMKFFTSGTVSMNVHLEKAVYAQGEGLKISAEIENSCSRAIKPKFAVEQKQSFFASGSTNTSRQNVIKETGESVASRTQSRVTAELKIPPDTATTITSCSILKVEYTLKAYLDVPYAKDPEIKIPLVILPASYDFGPLSIPDMPTGFNSLGNDYPGLNNQLPHGLPNVYPPYSAPCAQTPQASLYPPLPKY